MPEFSFQNPWYWLLAAVPASIPAFYWFFRRFIRRAISLPTLSLVPAEMRKRSSLSSFAWAFSCLSLMALVPVIAGIQRIGEPIPETSALMIVLDTSSSMTADDFAPEGRLGEAKKHLQRFVANAQYSEMGIVTYARSPRLMIPTTADRAAVHAAITVIREAEYGEDGTSIGSAIASAVNRLRAGAWRQRRIMLITDGVNNSGPISPLDAAKLARSLDIRIDTLGIGTDSVSHFRVPSPDGKSLPLEARIEIDEKSLEDVAQETGGTYSRARNSEELLKSLISLAGTQRRSSGILRAPASPEPARFLLVAAIAILAIGFLLSHFIFPKIPG
jgi:Ca-activated chloride channel homolog